MKTSVHFDVTTAVEIDHNKMSAHYNVKRITEHEEFETLCLNKIASYSNHRFKNNYNLVKDMNNKSV